MVDRFRRFTLRGNQPKTLSLSLSWNPGPTSSPSNARSHPCSVDTDGYIMYPPLWSSMSKEKYTLPSLPRSRFRALKLSGRFPRGILERGSSPLFFFYWISTDVVVWLREAGRGVIASAELRARSVLGLGSFLLLGNLRSLLRFVILGVWNFVVCTLFKGCGLRVFLRVWFRWMGSHVGDEVVLDLCIPPFGGRSLGCVGEISHIVSVLLFGAGLNGLRSPSRISFKWRHCET